MSLTPRKMDSISAALFAMPGINHRAFADALLESLMPRYNLRRIQYSVVEEIDIEHLSAHQKIEYIRGGWTIKDRHAP